MHKLAGRHERGRGIGEEECTRLEAARVLDRKGWVTIGVSRPRAIGQGGCSPQVRHSSYQPTPCPPRLSAGW